jgi:CheY-like chemotaxis protein
MNKEKFILIVDDDNRNIFALEAVLKARGYKVIGAATIEESVSKLEEYGNGIGIILMDIMMPDIDGYEGMTALKNNSMYRSIPIVAVTAKAMRGDREKTIAAGADDYLSKPVDVDALIEILNKHLKSDM